MLLTEQKRRKDLVLYQPANCFKHSSKIRTVKDVFKLPSKSLGEFKRAYGRDWVIGYVAMWLIELNDNSNVKTKMSDAQMDFTAERIYDTYCLKVTDLTLFFRNVKEGKYGGYYENLSQEKIMQWISLYWDERCEYGQMMSQSSHESFNINRDKLSPIAIQKLFAGIGEEEVNHNKRGNGSGARMKRKVMNNRSEFLNNMGNQFKIQSNEKLKEYLLEADSRSETFDQELFELAERELDSRK